MPLPQVPEIVDPAAEDIARDAPHLVVLDEPGDQNDEPVVQDNVEGKNGEETPEGAGEEEETEDQDTSLDEEEMVTTDVENAVTLTFVGILGLLAATKADIVSLRLSLIHI